MPHLPPPPGRGLAAEVELDLGEAGGGWFLHQTGTISPDSNNRWMGSAAIDKQGNIAVGYSVSSTSVAPSIRYATRSAGDPLGTMGAEATLQAGAGVQQSSSNRWGDYSSRSVDPADGCTFWYTTGYYANSGSFDIKTRIGKFKQAGCNQPHRSPIFALRSGIIASEGTAPWIPNRTSKRSAGPRWSGRGRTSKLSAGTS